MPDLFQLRKIRRSQRVEQCESVYTGGKHNGSRHTRIRHASDTSSAGPRMVLAAASLRWHYTFYATQYTFWLPQRTVVSTPHDNNFLEEDIQVFCLFPASHFIPPSCWTVSPDAGEHPVQVAITSTVVRMQVSCRVHSTVPLGTGVMLATSSIQATFAVPSARLFHASASSTKTPPSPFTMSGSPRGSKRKSSAGGSGRANTKRARGTNTKGKAPDVGGAASTSSTGAAPGDAAGAASAEKDKEENETRAHRRNPHGIAPDDVDGKMCNATEK
ncbi:hypothetical protein B0H13DRAFT_1903401 [Mycena leptocephala]|nr:hypothetical protein B0H13DRAFT_1903401 [Mycena leptocephala]